MPANNWILLPIVLAASLCGCGGDDTTVQEPPPVGEPPPPQAQPPPAPAPAPVVDTGPWAIDAARGQALFVTTCQRCHGENAAGGYGPALDNTATCTPCASYTQLWQRIEEFMPLRDPESCDAVCARDIAAWITNGFSTAASCSVEYVVDAATAQNFTARVRILNFRGLEVPAWRLGFTAPAGHGYTAASGASLSRSGEQVLLRSDAGLADGELLEVTLQGTHDGLAEVPADLRLEAPPCFTAAPG